MDFVTSSRLAALRKAHGLSQESLAEQIGVSRQAVSKWERAESSPDTDNLTALAALYGMTLDALLNGEVETNAETEAEADADADGKDVPSPDAQSQEGAPASPEKSSTAAHENEKHQADEPKEKEGIALAVKQHKERNSVRAQRARKKNALPHIHPRAARFLIRFPYFAVAVAAFVLTGYYTGAWNKAWLIFLTLPIWYGFFIACRAKTKRNFLLLCPAVFIAALIFLTGGIVFGVWHPTWLVFLAVPAYYCYAFGVKNNL